MKILGDYHTHTKASDGHSTVLENVTAAKEQGLKEVAITDHSFKSILCHLTLKKYYAQEREIENLNAEGGIRVLHGVEANLLNKKGKIDVPAEIIRKADILILGFHRFLQASVWRGAMTYIVVNGFFPVRIRKRLIGYNTAAYVNAMNSYPIDMLAHLNHRALVDTETVCRLAAEKGIYVELNSKHLDALEYDIDAVLKSGVKLIVGTDSHKTKNIGRAEKICEFMKKHGIPEDRVYGLTELPSFKDKSGYKEGTE